MRLLDWFPTTLSKQEQPKEIDGPHDFCAAKFPEVSAMQNCFMQPSAHTHTHTHTHTQAHAHAHMHTHLQEKFNTHTYTHIHTHTHTHTTDRFTPLTQLRAHYFNNVHAHV